MESRAKTAANHVLEPMLSFGDVDDTSTESESCEDEDTETQETKTLAWLKTLEETKRAFEGNPDDWGLLEEYKALVKKMDIYHPKDRATAKCDTFEEMKDVLGPYLGNLVQALSVQITNKHMLKGRSIQSSGVLRLCAGRLVEGDWQDVERWQRKRWTDPPLKSGALALEEVAPRYHKDDGRGWLHGWLFSDPGHVRVRIYWCGVPFSEDMVGFLRFIVALGESSAPDVFESPLAQVMCQVAWTWNLGIYIFRRAVDVLTVLLLVLVGLHSRVGNVGQSAGGAGASALIPVVGFLFICTNLINLAWCVLPISACFQVFDTVRPVMRFSLVLNWSFELIVLAVSTGLMLDANRFIKGHPVLIASLIVTKWLQLQLKVMSFDIFIDSVLPCYSALTSTASLSFLFYMVVSILGAVFAYFSLPRGNWESDQVFPGWDGWEGWEGYRNDFAHAAVATAQLTLLSMFDMNAIEGARIGYNARKGSDGNHTTFTQEIIDPERTETMHNDLPFLVLPNAFLFAVLVLNLYIGILSDEYSKAKNNLLQLKCRHRILNSLSNLLVLYMFGKHGFTRLFRSASAGIHDHVRLERSPSNLLQCFRATEGFWFAVPASPGDDNGHGHKSISHQLTFA